MVLTSTSKTLSELQTQETDLKLQIRDLQRQQKQVRATRKAIEKLTNEAPDKPKRKRSKKSSAPSSAAA